MRKKPDPIIVPLQSRMFAAGLRTKDVCERAAVNPSTWSRWAAGGVPDLATLRKIEAAVEAMILEDEQAAA